jgi:hypothetical protein
MNGRNYRIRYDFAHDFRSVQGVWQLAAAFAEIALRRRGPDSLPDSAFLLALVIIVDLAVYLVEIGFYGGIDRMGLVLFASDLLLLLVFVYAVLAFFRLERRFRQTVTAILGADIIISLSFLPIAAIATMAGLSVMSEPLVIVPLVFLFWQIYVSATILARSLSQPLIVGLGFEILYLCVTLFIAVLLTADASALDSTAG